MAFLSVELWTWQHRREPSSGHVCARRCRSPPVGMTLDSRSHGKGCGSPCRRSSSSRGRSMRRISSTTRKEEGNRLDFVGGGTDPLLGEELEMLATGRLPDAEGFEVEERELLDDVRRMLLAESVEACEFAVGKATEEWMLQVVEEAGQEDDGDDLWSTEEDDRDGAGEVEINLVFDPESGELTIDLMRNDEEPEGRHWDLSVIHHSAFEYLTSTDSFSTASDDEFQQRQQLSSEIGLRKDSAGGERTLGAQQATRAAPSFSSPFSCCKEDDHGSSTGRDAGTRAASIPRHQPHPPLRPLDATDQDALKDAEERRKTLQDLLDQAEDRVMTLTKSIIECRAFVRNNPERETSMLYYQELEWLRMEAWQQRRTIGEKLERAEVQVQRLRSRRLQP